LSLSAGGITPPCAAPAAEGDGLLHDAGNLISALSLYCDLLLMPHVLKPEHRHYADELRLLGSRSAAMIEQLMEHRIPASLERPDLEPPDPGHDCAVPPGETTAQRRAAQQVRARTQLSREISPASAQPMSLGSIVKRCSGLLSRVAGGRVVEIGYGQAAAIPIPVAAESIERILVNLVRNAARALDRGPNHSPGRGLEDAERCDGSPPLAIRLVARAAAPPARSRGRGAASSEPMRETLRGSHAAIRIGVGVLANRAGELRPWPFRRVRLVVEDSGCGMGPGELDRLLAASRAPAVRTKHGIGFRVVQHLVDVSGGELSVTSAPGLGTTVQIEWPLVPSASGRGNL